MPGFFGLERRAHTVIAVAACGVVISAASFIVGIEEDMSSGIQKAFENGSSQTSRVDLADRDQPLTRPWKQKAAYQPPQAGSEDFWLGHAKDAPGLPVSLSGPVTLGDELTLSINGRVQVFTVTRVAMVPDHESSLTGRQIVELSGLAVPDASGTKAATRMSLTLELPTAIRATEAVQAPQRL